MWIIIWGVFAVLMIGFAAWNMTIMWQQKQAWKSLADKYKLNYESTGFMNSPNVSGKIDRSYFSLFSGVQRTDDVRGERFVTALEFMIGKGMPTGGALGTARMKSFIDTLIFEDTYVPDIEGWDESYVLRARDEEGIRAYLTKERLEELCRIFKMKNSTVLFFFDELEAVLRIETSDPLRNADHLEKIVNRLRDSVELLIPTAEEKRKFKTLLRDEEKRRLEKEKRLLDYDPDLDDHKLELELEEEGESQGAGKLAEDAEKTATEISLEEDSLAIDADISADKDADKNVSGEKAAVVNKTASKKTSR